MEKEVKKEEQNQPIFAKGMCFSKIFWIFMIGSFIGCVYEVILSRFQFGQFESRAGLVYGPFNPVYGVGLVVIVLFLYRIQNPFLQFVTGSFVGGLTEYIIWFLQRVIFQSESWNYQTPFILNGRPFLDFLFWGGTSFFHSLFWGLAAFIVMRLFYPKMCQLIEQMPYKFGKIFTNITVIFIVIDILLTGLAVIRQNERTYCSDINNVCEVKDGIGGIMDDFLDTLFPDDYMNFVFPNMNRDIKNASKI